MVPLKGRLPATIAPVESFGKHEVHHQRVVACGVVPVATSAVRVLLAGAPAGTILRDRHYMCVYS